jgi:hypothetical protein
MVLGYDYSKQKRRWWRTNAPHPPAILMATAMRQSNTDSIAQCGMSRATPEATGCRHWVTTCSVLPQWLPGQQAYKQLNKYTCKDGHFDGHGDAPVCNRAHCLMEEVQSFTRSHWTPPLGKYYAR